MKNICVAVVCFLVALVVTPMPASAQTVQQRLDALERKVERLQERADNMAERLDRLNAKILEEREDRIARDAALRARVAKLEGKNLEAADFVGTYTVANAAVAVDPDPNSLVSYVVGGTATFNADGTGTISATAAGVGITEGAPSETWAHNGASEDTSTPFNWTYTGGVLSVTVVAGDTLPDFAFSVAAGAQVLVSVSGGAPGNNQTMAVWTKQ